MKFNRTKAEPLLLWMNTMFPEEPIWEFIHMTNGVRLLEICCKLSGEENFEGFKTSSLHKKLEIILCVLHDNFNLTKRQSSLILQKINQGIDLELQLAKVALLLCYCSFKKGGLLSMDSESEIISMFRFVKDDADGLSLDEGLDLFLDQDSVMNGGSSDRSLLYTDDESPNVGRVQRLPRVQFQELCTVASSSDRSPVQDVMNTPQFQLKRLRKELAHEGDVRDELEKELSDQINIISEKEGLIIQLQHRVDRLLREQEELEKDHKDALLELQEKNESLLRRVHEVVKQCQDLKIENSQKDKKIDELTEENHTFAAQVRNAFAQLARAEEEVTKLTLAHESSQAEWRSKKEFLEHELNEAVSHKECLSEQVQILQGKISVLEDELQKAQSQEKGEVLGPIMEWEKLKQELADLTLKLAELQDTISRLEKEKAEVEILLAEERASFEKETGRLQMVVLDLEQSINSIRLERETLEEALQSQKEMLTAQISALESDVSRLQLVEIQLTTEIKISADLRQQREELEAKVVSLDKKVHVLYAEIQGLETERASQQDSLNALIVELQSAKNTIQDYEKKIESNSKEHEETVKKLQQELQSAASAASENQEEVQVLSAEVTSLKEQICRYSENEVLKQQQMSVLERQNNVMQDNLTSLQSQLAEATTIASHKDSELLLLQNELHQQESFRKKAQELETAQREELERMVSELQAKILEVSTRASEREALLQSELKDQLRAKQSEDDLRRELEEKLGTLQEELDSVNRCAADKDSLLGSLDQKLKDLEGLFLQKEKDVFEMNQAKEDLEKRLVDEKLQLEEYQQSLDIVKKERDHLSTEVTSLNEKISSYQDTEVQKQQEISVLEVECKLLKENMAALEKKLVEETTIASQKNSELLMLQNELHQQESLREKAQELETAKHEELERMVSELQTKILEVSTRASEREALLQSELKDQLSAKQSEDDLRRKLEEKLGTLQEELDSVNRCAADKDNLLGSLDQKLKEMEGRFLQKEKDVFEIHEAKKDLEKRLVDEKHQLEEYQQSLDVVKKERDHLSTEITSLNEKIVSYQDTEVQKQQEISVLEVECKLLKENMAALEKKLVEETTIASQKNSEVRMLQNELHQQESLREKAQELETAKHEELERTVSELQAKILEVSTLASEREALLQSELKDQLRAKQSEDDLRRELEEKLGTLQEELDSVNRCAVDKDNLLGSLDQKLKEMEGLFLQKEKECNLLKENMAALEKLVEETTVASQKNSELLMLQNELHQQESLREKAQELEIAKHEELERTVSDLQAKILEVSTRASEREAQVISLQNEMNAQESSAKQSKDDLCRELEKVETLQRQLETANHDITDKDQLLQTLNQKLNQIELLCQQKENVILDLHQVKEDLEKRIDELVVEKQQQLEGSQQSLEMVLKERDHLSTEVTSLNDKIRSYQENEVQKQQEISVLEVKVNTLMDNLVAFKTEVAELTNTVSQKESEILLLQNEFCEQEKFREKALDLEKNVSDLQAKIQDVSALASERESQLSSLQDEMNDQHLRTKQSEDDLRTALEEKVETLRRQLDAASCDVTDKDHLLQSLDQKLKQVELLCQQKGKDVLEMQQAKEELEKRIVELQVDKHQLDVYQQKLEMLRQERSHLTSLNQTLQRNCDASQKIRAELELKVEEQNGSILALKKASQQWEEQNQELVEQLKIKLEAVEHYKAQMEKAKNHYNGKKQQLVEVQELNRNFAQSLEASKREVKALETELKMARMELDQANAKEKKLAAKVKSLEAQVDFTDRHLREQRRVTDGSKDMRRRESHYIRGKYQDTSSDSVDFELNDSLNANSQSVAPGESSTPLVRSSERLAAKRLGLGSESLETLYFTPMGKQGTKCKEDPRDAFERKLESSISSIGDLVVDSAKKLTASARRRRTTQVINITLAKKTQGSAEGEDSFSSLHSARSQPNLAVHHSRPISVDLSEESLSQPDTLQNLPGYRRSTAHSVAPQRATSTFCIGEENEPEHAADDWMRIAELQARNKACLPHLKSSYPLESRPSLGPSFTVTDEVLRMGDPDETIRRASMVPGQILDTLNSRRFSLAPGASSSQVPAHSQPQRATMLPGQIRSSTAAHQASQLTKTNTRSPLAPKRPGSQLQDPDTPEAKKLASCFPRPMTPKGRFGNSQNRPPKSPAERRQSVVFTVVNTPKSNARGDSRLQRGLNKLRNSARKSPAVAGRALRSAVSGRSPMHSTLRKSPRNKSPKSSNAKKIKFKIKV